MTVAAVWSPVDLVLSLVVPLGMALHRGTALVVDIDPAGPPMHGGADLATLVSRGPTEAELNPKHGGVAFLANGGVSAGDAGEVISALGDRWPNLVLRCAPTGAPPRSAVPVLPLLPAPFALTIDGPCVYQRTAFGGDVARGAPVLPLPKRDTVRALISGRTPARRDRWIGALEQVWEMA